MPIVSDEERLAIIEQATAALLMGESTEDIAPRLNVSGRTLRSWLIGDPRAGTARKLLMAGELSRTLDEMRTADGPLPLARAREEFRGWSWLAERRLPEYYGQKQEVTHRAPDGPVISIVLASATPSPRPIEGEYSMESVAPPDPAAP
jgi:transposase-like protein